MDNSTKKQFPAIINGTYMKDRPNEDIGYQKWKVTKTYEVDVTYEIVAKTKDDAEKLLEKEETPTEEVDAFGKTFRETIKSKFTNDLRGDEPTTWTKIEECVPSDYTDSDNNFKPFINYDDPNWTTHEFEWLKNEDGTNMEKK